MSETQAAMGAIARGQRFIEALKTDDPEHVITWGEASGAIAQLIGYAQHEQREHEKTGDLLKLVERSSDALITRYRDALVLIAGLDDPRTGEEIGSKHDAREVAREALRTDNDRDAGGK